MWTFIEITNIIFEALIVFYFLNGIYRPAKFPFKRGMLVYFVYVALLAVLTFAPVSPIIRIIYSLLSTWCICALVYRSSILDSVYVSLVFITIVMLADQLCILVLNSFGINIESTMTSGSARTMTRTGFDGHHKHQVK